MDLFSLCTEAGLAADVAEQLVAEEVSVSVLLAATLSERREVRGKSLPHALTKCCHPCLVRDTPSLSLDQILRAMGMSYGAIMVLNRALMKRQEQLREEAGSEEEDSDGAEEPSDDSEDDNDDPGPVGNRAGVGCATSGKASTLPTGGGADGRGAVAAAAAHLKGIIIPWLFTTATPLL